MQCSMTKALRAAEGQVLRFSGLLNKLIYLVQNVRDDGELVTAQRQKFEQIVAQCDAVTTGRNDELYGLSKEDRRELIEYLKANVDDFAAALGGVTGVSILTKLEKTL